MRSVTASFTSALTNSYRLAATATVINTAAVQTVIDIVDGSVTLDQTAAVRGRCDVTVADDGTLGLVPQTPTSSLAPYGNEVQLRRGMRYPDGTTEMVSLGVFGIREANIEDSPGSLVVRISGLDRSARFVDARFEDPYNVAAGTNYATAILTVLQAAWPAVPYNFASTALTTPLLVAEEGDDRWKFAQDMANAISMRLYFDGDGTLQLAPDALSSAVMSIAEGQNGVLIQATRNWTREGTYNRVIATGENTGLAVPVRGVATDTNPLSPTYYFGPFGKVPMFYSSPFLTTNTQAAAAAQTVLDRQLGTTEQLSFGSFVIPHLEPSDTVRVTRLRSGIDEDHVIDSLTIPMGADGVLDGQTRARQVV